MTATTSTSSSTKIPSSSKSSATKQTKQKRNERERKRVNQVNQGFVLLQERVPKVAGNKAKLSKVETLREATRYIQELQKQLGMIPQGMPVDFPTPEQSPVYPKPYCNINAQTPSPNYISPYYPPPQQMMSLKHDMSAQYYSGQENSSSASSSSADSHSGEHHNFYSHGDNY